jgi:hypothetical protein
MQDCPLPVEILEQISQHINVPKDFVNFSLSCRDTSYLSGYVLNSVYRMSNDDLSALANSFKFKKHIEANPRIGKLALVCWWMVYTKVPGLPEFVLRVAKLGKR